MTHDQTGLEAQRDGPDPIEQVAAGLYSGGTVFEETELKRMRSVLDAICDRLGITPDSEHARAAAQAIIHHSSVGNTDIQALKDAIIEKLRAHIETAPA